jgi:prolyl-tRNA synthetase
MRSSQFFLPTLKELPAEAVLSSHQFMLRAGLIRKISSGLYTWLPLGLKVLRKVENIIRQEMNASGALELLLPILQPADLWRKSARWDKYGSELMRLQDRHKRDFCLGPTHEEIVTFLINNDVSSYKQLPLNVYQLQAKFRDEIRPRFGVMRAREFIMKDAYSFHATYSSLQEYYELMKEAYHKIFTRLNLNVVCVAADSGSIGGSLSHEFHVLADSGEDAIVLNQERSYAANLELAPLAASSTLEQRVASEDMREIDTPNLTSINDIVSHCGVAIEQTVKTLVVKGAKDKLVALVIRGDHHLNHIKAAKHKLVAQPLTMADKQEIEKITGSQVGFIGPVGLNIPLIVDYAAASLAAFTCGANQQDKHLSGVNWDRDCPAVEIADLRNIVAGDPSPCGKGIVEIKRGIEVGHIFQLGDKYTKAMHSQVINKEGKNIYPLMGCYGIGVSRIVAAAIEQNANNELKLPASLAPFSLAIILINPKNDAQVIEYANSIYQQLLDEKIEVLYFDQDQRPGIKFANAELISIPHRIVISGKSLETDLIEYKNMFTSTQEQLPKENFIQEIKTKLSS